MAKNLLRTPVLMLSSLPMDAVVERFPTTTAGLTAGLLYQRNAIRQLVLDDGADLVLDLEVPRHLGHREDG